jgi:hemerythrin
MPLIQWDDTFSVGMAEIDRQHQKLVGMINDLHEAMREGKGKEILGPLIEGLVTYAATHFRTEERLFDRYAYPETDEHKNIHAAFAAKAVEFKSRFDRSPTGLSVEIMHFLSDWLQKHIKGADKKYGPYLNAQGVK